MDKKISGLTSLKGTVTLPPDKSIAHRAVMFASLARGVSLIENFSQAADPQTTLSCFRQLGVDVENNKNQVIINGKGRYALKKSDVAIDCGNSGTTMRLMAGVLTGAGIEGTLIGDDSLSGRPMKRIIDPLHLMGARIESRSGGYPPLTLFTSKKINPIEYTLPVASAQVKSCVLLAGLYTDTDTAVIETKSSRDHTERLLGLRSTVTPAGVRIVSNNTHEIPTQNFRIPGDFSAAAFWLVAGSIYPDAAISLPGSGINPTRTAAMQILNRMGANMLIQNQHLQGLEPVADLYVTSSVLQPVEITPDEVPNCIDELPILSIAMMFADGVSQFSGAGELRHKESDRLKAIAQIIRSAGGTVKEDEDGLTIVGNPAFRPNPSTFITYHDHRLAMSAAILSGLGHKPSVIKNAECTAISYPQFWDDLGALSGI